MTIEQLRQGRPMSGTMVRLTRDPAVLVMARGAGMDFVMLDMEHGAFSIETVWAMATPANGTELSVFVRVPELSRGWVSRALDCGCAGVMSPMIETVEQARALAGWAKYPPLGGRGLTNNGPHTTFRRWADVSAGMAQANRGTLAIAQIESKPAIEAIDGIAAVEGIDVLLIGPNDLSVSLGRPGDMNSAEQIACIDRVADACRRHGKILGMHAPADYMARWVPSGLRFVMNNIDSLMLDAGLKAAQQQNQALMDKMKS